MEKDRIVYPYILVYLRSVRRLRTGLLGEIEKKARLENFPVSGPETSDLLELLCRLRQPERILEIGTCIGFSALLMAETCQGAHIDTVERNPVMLPLAKENFAKFPHHHILQMEGDALDILPKLDGGYDLVFMDAAKGQYPKFFMMIKSLLKKGGILVADNVLFNGYVAEGAPDVRRNRTIVTRLDEYLKTLENDADFQTVILPVSDGVTVSYKIN